MDLSHRMLPIFLLPAQYLAFFTFIKKKLCITIAFLISFSRVYVGVHFPGDVIFGGMLGYLIAIISITFYSKLVLNKNKKELIR